jgi:hypothetical protein
MPRADMDPEVDRLGYSDPQALTLLEEAARRCTRPLARCAGSVTAADGSVDQQAPCPPALALLKGTRS